jgi:RNA polymerase sigma-70 factor (ECF subfamily)
MSKHLHLAENEPLPALADPAASAHEPELPPAGAAPPRQPELDQLTLVRAQRGDLAARRALVDRYKRPIFALLGRMLHRHQGRARVEDLAQDTFLKIFRALPTFDPGRGVRLSTWILTIASNLAIDELRRGRHRALLLGDDAAAAIPGGESPAADAERRSLAAALSKAIDGLSPEHRAAFLLREYHELSYVEIAEATGIDLGTVKSRLNRARAALRAALAEVYHAHQ